MLKIRFNNHFYQTDNSGGELLSDLITNAGIMLDLRCGGSGVCGRCRVTLISGRFSIKDRIIEVGPGCPVESFSCRTRVESGNAEISVPLTSVIHPDGQIAMDFELLHLQEINGPRKIESSFPLGLAIDIGTTTVAVALLDLERNRVLATVSAYNRQSQCGDNVSSRISYSIGKGGLEHLRSLLIADTVNPLIRRLLADTGNEASGIGKVSVSGNTVMSHLFLGISPASIGALPFTPATRIYPQRSAAECELEINPAAAVTILPSVSGYIGGDLTAGILVSGIDKFDGRRSLLIDIGTNCEIILNDGEQLFACAAAAGPAFEGAGIFCGSRAAGGAVDHIRIDKGLELTYSTINGENPAGLCGSGLVDFMAAGFSCGLIDEFGRYDPGKLKRCGRYLEIDYGHGPLHAAEIAVNSEGKAIYVSEADIEQALKAKAAVYAGISSLLDSANLKLTYIDQVHLAGGFARYLNVANAIVIGMLPPFAAGKIHQLGNSALAGAIMNTCLPEFYHRAGEIIDLPQVVELNLLPDFEDSYIDALLIPNFDPDKFYHREGA
ncbi:MAG: ASKHA domain-containing protein [Victivallales bacterium]|nr:ASKHA domain-containing protein [Victivallales bacterium]